MQQDKTEELGANDQENMNVQHEQDLASDEAVEEQPPAPRFDFDLIKKYPRANRRLKLQVQPCGVKLNEPGEDGLTVFISPHGVEFKTQEKFSEGELVKVMVKLPHYWERKQRFVEYSRIDAPEEFRILGRVVQTEEIGKRKKKCLVTVQTLVIDEIDEKVLRDFLKD